MDKRQLAQLTDLAQNGTDAATRGLGRSHVLAREADAKLALLETYRTDYQARLTAAARTGLCPDVLRNYHDFLGKLDAAIKQQCAVVASCQARVEATRQEWQNANRKLKSFSTLADRTRQREVLQGARRDQREQDESALRRSGNPLAYPFT